MSEPKKLVDKIFEVYFSTAGGHAQVHEMVTQSGGQARKQTLNKTAHDKKELKADEHKSESDVKRAANQAAIRNRQNMQRLKTTTKGNDT